MRSIYFLLIMVVGLIPANAQLNSEIFDFEFEGVVINGILNQPEAKEPKGLVLIIHGSGRTNAVAQEWYADVRETILNAGYATYMWDKMGCGKSGGTFDINQPVQNSALEAIAAINTLKVKQIPGSEAIGLWGGSRAGWINPLVINQYKDIKFWISVSGVDDKENFGYLLEQNLRIDGLPKDSVDLIVQEWKDGNKIGHSGGSYGAFLDATQNLRETKFWLRFTGGEITKKSYYDFQPTFMKTAMDEKTGVPVVISGFETILSNVKCPVLALFGEKDMNVDWTKTKALYERTLAKNTELSIKSFPDCNHNMFKCNTGGFYEFQDNDLPYERCDGYLEAMGEWLLRSRW
ncbi:alpha/beta hydrolase family protein [Poritiphilus flavus]|uniref:Alpha/beta hydrolase n=1 Tax=Poritiphilus flavus TaxID=2697053 RepID=A0A6L9ECN7_9FLAO|nr:dienelactone hydrolase family protein [Poritiphilus flavus]NAS12159.1 alpha/beta hydrolase [Poritiphilus flavus]